MSLVLSCCNHCMLLISNEWPYLQLWCPLKNESHSINLWKEFNTIECFFPFFFSYLILFIYLLNPMPNYLAWNNKNSHPQNKNKNKILVNIYIYIYLQNLNCLYVTQINKVKNQNKKKTTHLQKLCPLI